MTAIHARPRVSVVVPAKDQAAFVDDALGSLARQLDDLHELEVVVVDDGSTDGTGELVAQHDARLPVLRLLRNETPVGPASARNQGLAEVHGRFVAFLDPDDWFAPRHLQRLADALETLDVDFVRTDHVRHEGGRRTVRRVPEHRRGTPLDPRSGIGPADRTTPVDYCFPPFGLYDARLLEDGLLAFPSGRFTAEDRPWIWDLHLHARSYAVVDSVGAFYRRGVPTSLTQVRDPRQLDFLPCYDLVLAMIREDRAPETLWPKAVQQLLAIACHHLERSPESYRPDVVAGIAKTLANAPDDVVRAVVGQLDTRRRDLLADVPGLKLRSAS